MTHHYKKYYFLILAALLYFSCSFSLGAKENHQTYYRKTDVLGTWWWYVPHHQVDSHLAFAAEKGVNEIYYYTMLHEYSVGSFIEKANNLGIKVFLLTDDYNYVWDRPAFIQLMFRFMNYQSNAPENRRFAGLHMDIEPHQHPDFDANRYTILQDYMNFVVWLNRTYRPILERSTPGIQIDWDIATWHYIYVMYNGVETKLYQALIMEADRVFVMAYQDSAQRTFNLARPEIEFARSLNKPIIIGAETGRWIEDPSISFYGKGRNYFYEQLGILHELINYDQHGLSVHHISPWYSME
ncbi:MAG: hypothetical protein LBE79_07045 [Tannerella sp.]|jgi:hypothetical protein|nr:hypothetical protein [Tannerella sp.]